MTPTPLDPRLARIRQRLDRKNPASGLKDKLKRMKAQQRRQQAPSGPQQLPWSAEADTKVGGLNRDLDFSNRSLDQREAAVRQNYGFDDPTNPYSRANQLQRNYQQRTKATLGQAAGSGGLYHGALSQRRALDRREHEMATDTERRGYQAELAEIAQKRLEAQRTHDEGLVAAEAGRLEEAIQERPDPTTAPPETPQAKAEREKRERDKRESKGGSRGGSGGKGKKGR